MEYARRTELQVAVYEPTVSLRRPLDLWRAIASDVFASRHLSWQLFRRDLLSQHRQSFLGVFLVFLPALFTTAWAVMFRQASIINVGELALPYPFFVLLGMMIWSTFTESIDAPISGLMTEQSLIAKSNVPSEAVTVARLLLVAFNLTMKVIVIIVVAIAYGITPMASLVMVPVAVVSIIAFGFGIGMFLSPINLLYRDISKTLPVALTMWFFLTPIVFVLPKGSAAEFIMLRLNPITSLLTTARDIGFSGFSGISSGFLLSLIVSVVVFVLGATFSRVAIPIVLDRSSS